MANATDPLALHARGSDPQLLLEPGMRHAVHASRYWHVECFGTSLADLAPLAARLRRVSADLAPPAPFVCLLLKLLQLAPAAPEIDVFLQQPHFKYARALAAFYVRLTAPPYRVYAALEPLLADFRRLVVVPAPAAQPQLLHLDQLVDRLLRDVRVAGITLPRLPPRHVVADAMPTLLTPRRHSILGAL